MTINYQVFIVCKCDVEWSCTFDFIHAFYFQALLFTLRIMVLICINGVMPLFYELGVELAHPVHEGLSCAFITVIGNLNRMLFYLTFQIPALADGKDLGHVMG